MRQHVAATSRKRFAQASSSVMQRAPSKQLRQEECVRKASLSFVQEAPLCTSPYLSLYQPGHAWATTVSLVMIIVIHRPKCIYNNYRCPQAGWTIEEYCEACHG